MGILDGAFFSKASSDVGALDARGIAGARVLVDTVGMTWAHAD